MDSETLVKWFDSVLHAAGGAAIATFGMALGNSMWGSVALLTLAGLLRELAQKDGSNIIKALQTMPDWKMRVHVEWLSWGIGAYVAALAINWYFGV